MEEHRRAPRITTDALVDYTGKNVLLYHKIQNISIGGIAIQSPEVEEVGTEVDLTINFPDLNETIEVKGEVVWANTEVPKDMGIKFKGLTDHDKDILRRYMELVRMQKNL